MPKGTHHELTGFLLEGDGFYPVLRVPDGGEWRLEVIQRYKHLLGHRVTVRGTRDGFDLLCVTRVEAL